MRRRYITGHDEQENIALKLHHLHNFVTPLLPAAPMLVFDNHR